MNVLSIMLGLLVGLFTSIVVVVVTAAATIVSIGRDAITAKKAPRKATQNNTHAAGTDATVVKIPERRRDTEVRPAA